jgi:hypothetical protein
MNLVPCFNGGGGVERGWIVEILFFLITAVWHLKDTVCACDYNMEQ